MSSGGNKVVDLWRDRDGSPGQSLPRDEPASPYAIDFDEALSAQPGRWRKPFALTLCIGGALAWLGALSYSRYTIFAARAATLDDMLGTVSLAAAPLALLAALWLVIQRSSRAEADSFVRTTNALQLESQRMESLLAFVSARIDASRRDLSDQGDSLMAMGEDAATRLNAATEAMRKEIDTINSHAQNLRGSATATRGDLAVLLAQLPKTQILMRQITSQLAEVGDHAETKSAILEEKLTGLENASQRASDLADGTSVYLGEQLERMHQMTAETATMLADSQTALGQAGLATHEVLAARVADLGAQVERIAATFAAQDAASRELATRLESDIGTIEARFAAFNSIGTEQSERMATALTAIHGNAEAVTQVFGEGSQSLIDLSSRADSLAEQLKMVGAKLSHELPQNLGDIESRSREALQIIDAAQPALTGMADTANLTLANVRDAEAVIAAQQGAMAQIAEISADHVTKSRATADELASIVRQTTAEAQAFADGAGLALVDALVRAKEAARQAVDHSRDAFAQLIPQSANELGEASKAALTEALHKQVETQMDEIAAITEKAVGAAQAATDRLMRQMLTISETSAALEARIAEAKEEADTADHSHFARRVALLIESLNSTAIDVTKVLSNEVTDTAWASYLRGDRGIFSRRAVKLLDASETREIVRHYQDDVEFRDQVNRYIHDYEAMLRSVMSTRDGAPLSVALLSSDTGKLYVSLAQAIERLRT